MNYKNQTTAVLKVILESGHLRMIPRPRHLCRRLGLCDRPLVISYLREILGKLPVSLFLQFQV